MEIIKTDRLLFSKATLNTFDLSAFSIDESAVIKYLSEDLDEDLSDLNNPETKKDRMEFLNISGVVLEDYSERIVEIGDSRFLVCGIRHEGGDPKLPFVSLISNFELNFENAVAIYHDHLSKYFSVFDPLHVQFWSKSKPNHSQIRSTYMASLTEDIIKQDPWPEEKSMNFVNISDDSYYKWYEAQYNELHLSQPELRGEMPINSPSTMQVSIDEGLLKFVEYEDQRIGLIAAENDDFLGFSGVCFNEIFLSKDWKKKDLEKVMQRKFLSEFCQEQKFILETVDYNNKDSYQVALSNGRKPVRYEQFVKLK